MQSVVLWNKKAEVLYFGFFISIVYVYNLIFFTQSFNGIDKSGVPISCKSYPTFTVGLFILIILDKSIGVPITTASQGVLFIVLSKSFFCSSVVRFYQLRLWRRDNGND